MKALPPAFGNTQFATLAKPRVRMFMAQKVLNILGLLAAAPRMRRISLPFLNCQVTLFSLTSLRNDR